MRTPVTNPRLWLATIVTLLAVSGCQTSSLAHPVPSVSQIGSDLQCTGGDHGFEDLQAGWGFCYPGTWKYNERAQSSSSPPGLDLTFDITDIPCTSPAASAGGASQPVCSPGAGLFAFMIISTYQRGDATSLAAWAGSNLPSAGAFQPITWGNAVEAVKLPDGRRLALTPHHVVIMDLRSGSGNLNLESEMSARLGTWKFKF